MVKSLNASNAVSCASTDADYNSAKNQVANLPPIYVNRQNRKKLRYHHLARTTGFYWLCEPNPDSEALTGEI